MCYFTMCERRLYGGRWANLQQRKREGKMRMIKQNRGNQNKFIYNNKNAYLSVPLLMMSARRMNLCKEKKRGGGGGGGGRRRKREREKKKKKKRTPSCLSKTAKAK